MGLFVAGTSCQTPELLRRDSDSSQQRLNEIISSLHDDHDHPDDDHDHLDDDHDHVNDDGNDERHPLLIMMVRIIILRMMFMIIMWIMIIIPLMMLRIMMMIPLFIAMMMNINYSVDDVHQ